MINFRREKVFGVNLDFLFLSLLILHENLFEFMDFLLLARLKEFVEFGR